MAWTELQLVSTMSSGSPRMNVAAVDEAVSTPRRPVLKFFAFQDRHANEDAYDLVFVRPNSDGGPAAGTAAAISPIADRWPNRSRSSAERFADGEQVGTIPTRGYARLATWLSARLHGANYP